tara:strand:- start:3020 stop:3214 length:195 start_codon:yes stop_codon:yes gene_type:complete
MNYIEKNNLNDIQIIDTNWSSETHQELKKKYGKTQVPLLLINDEPLYESRDIIDYFRRHYELSN